MPEIINVIHNFALPSDTQQSVITESVQCRNLGLLLDKYQPWGKCRFNNGQVDWAMNFEYIDTHHHPKFAKSSEAKGYWLNWQTRNRVSYPQKQLRPNDRFDTELFEHFLARYINTFPEDKRFSLRSQSRIIIGLGTKGTLEMGITLHPLYGFPYIPGSALKGLARTYGIYRIAPKLEIPNLDGETLSELKNNKQPTPLQVLDAILEMPLEIDPTGKFNQEQFIALEKAFEQLKTNPLINAKGNGIDKYTLSAFLKMDEVTQFRKIFGTMGHAGEIVFFDSIPGTIENIIAAEIMTPHFSEYYQEGKFPQDDQDPGPLVYLAIKENIPFLFCLDHRKRADQDEELRKTAKKWLYNGLKYFGIGGKTSSGMGMFSK